MELQDVLAAIVTVGLVFAALAGFDMVRDQPIAWLFDGLLAVGFGVFVFYVRTTVESPEEPPE